MITARWLESRRPHWSRLERIVRKCGRREVAALARPEIRELGLLYRQTAADLSAVREDPASRRLAAYLNELMGRAHNLIYAGRGTRPGALLRFFASEYPRVLRETAPYTLAAAAVFCSAAAAGFLAASHDPDFQRHVLGAPMIETIERREMWTHSIVSMKPLASSAILTNNLLVTMTAVAAGVTAGVGTLYILLTNGLLLGVIAAACFQAGMSASLWTFVAPHGALEFPAIFVSGGAGFLIARGLLFPGLRPRREVLARAGGAAARLAAGLIPMLLIAGAVEGFVSPSGLPAAAKLAVSASLALLLALYLASGRRSAGPSASVEPVPDARGGRGPSLPDSG